MSLSPPKAETVVEFLERHLTANPVPQIRIAEAIGVPRNLVSMIITGKSKLPVIRCEQFAEVIGADAKALFRVAMCEYQPELMNTIDRLYSPPPEGVDETSRELIQTAVKAGVDAKELRAIIAGLRAYAYELKSE